MPTPGPHPRISRVAAAVERTPVTVFPNSHAANRAVAEKIAGVIREKADRGELAVLGLATGSTPVGVYAELVRMHQEEKLSFGNVVSFNLDEYWPMRPEAPQSYVRFMREHLFDHVDINPANIHIPDGTITREQMPAFCETYERKVRECGGLDLQILGIGRTGHVGFNEPGSARDSRTRLITLDRVTRMDAAGDFFGEWNVPRKALTMGVGTILSARKVILIAFGEHKAPVIRRAVEEPPTPTLPASYLQDHPDAEIVLDESSAAELTRFKTPWRLATMHEAGLKWNELQTRKAAIWLSQHTGKPLLKLTDEDYNENGLQELLSARGSAYEINLEVFRALQKTITGWPGGKPVHEDGAESDFPRRIVVFSPHPDDDVISMGGTLIRLCEQGHEVHVAYQTSGNIAVWDESAFRHADFVTEFCRAFHMDVGSETAGKIEASIRQFASHKTPGEPDSPELRHIKTLIRRTEARAAARSSGVDPRRIHFLDLPFYETGTVRKMPLGEGDIRIMQDLLEAVQPSQVYAAGDLSDPHGTHRVCLAGVVAALDRLRDRPWRRSCTLWLYRGAWQEWSPHEIDMAVPLSPDEVTRKRMAIFKHESQKDRALFPGPSDAREFWQRAEERNRQTAHLYDRLGLAEYEALEGFVSYRPPPPPDQQTVVEVKLASRGGATTPSSALPSPASSPSGGATPRSPQASRPLQVTNGGPA